MSTQPLYTDLAIVTHQELSEAFSAASRAQTLLIAAYHNAEKAGVPGAFETLWPAITDLGHAADVILAAKWRDVPATKI